MYNEEKEEVTWETCTLRVWLNGEFFGSAFSYEEQAMIPTVTVSADENPCYDIDPGNATRDKVFLLGVDEIEKYFNSYTACKPTAYAVANGAANSFETNCLWWLRTPGEDRFSAVIVEHDGTFFERGEYIDVGGIAVRPAMWIDLGA